MENVRNWFSNHDQAIRPEECEYINKDGDVIALVPRLKTPLRRFLEHFDCFLLSPLFRVWKVSNN